MNFDMFVFLGLEQMNTKLFATAALRGFDDHPKSSKLSAANKWRRLVATS
jgi:hypothetical protein